MSGYWLQTFLGHAFEPLDPCVEDINIRDIAHGLAYQCRFHGHTRTFSSVAEHSIVVMTFVTFSQRNTVAIGRPDMPYWVPLAALLHDAHEAYLGDMPRPIKKIPEVAAVYKPIEDNVQRVIHAAFGLSWPVEERWVKVIKNADDMALALEKRDQMCRPPRDWDPLPKLPTRLRVSLVKPMSPEEAEAVFLDSYYRLVEGA